MEKTLSNRNIKNIAIVCMVIDHIGVILIGSMLTDRTEETWNLYLFLRIVGRLAFPLYCFLTAEGIRHTRNIKAYFMRLICLAVISEAVYDLASYGKLFCANGQNVLWTLALSVLPFCIAKRSKLIQWALAFLACIAAGFLRTDYGGLGVLLAATFVFNRRAGKFLSWVIIMTNLGRVLPLIPQICVSLILIIILHKLLAQYNGKRSNTKEKHKQTDAMVKILDYSFYPLHLVILLCFRTIIS